MIFIVFLCAAIISLRWVVEVDAAKGSIYEGQTFQLKFKFNDRYPFDSPSVMFIGQIIPEHSHIYSNGHICLSILSDDWTPALSVQAVCLSILSMLSSATKKERPPDDMIYTKTCRFVEKYFILASGRFLLPCLIPVRTQSERSGCTMMIKCNNPCSKQASTRDAYNQNLISYSLQLLLIFIKSCASIKDQSSNSLNGCLCFKSRSLKATRRLTRSLALRVREIKSIFQIV